MEKSTKIGLGIFVVILVVGFLVTQGNFKSSNPVTGNAVVLGNPGEVVEVKTTIKNFKYEPDIITVKEGSFVRLTIENKDNVVHGLHLPQFGIVDSQPALATKTVEFKAIVTPTNGQAVPTCSQEHGETLTFIIS